MKIFRPSFVALGLATVALSSCERSYSYYSFQSKAPAHLGSVPTTGAPLAAPIAPATAEADPKVSAVVSVAPTPVPVPETKAALAALPTATMMPVAISLVAAVAPTNAGEPSLVKAR